MENTTDMLTDSQTAQQLAYQAMTHMYEDDEKAAELCREALEIYPDCVDARSMLAEIESEDITDYVKAMEKTVESGKQHLGHKFFNDECGNFGKKDETKPFMRAMILLANGYREMGKNEYSKAIDIYEEMLILNPEDNQGVRYFLLDCYLSKKMYQHTKQLFEQYREDSLEVFNWAKVLYEYVINGVEAAQQAFDKAMEQNSLVPKYLAGKKRIPRTKSGNDTDGKKEDAIFCASVLNEAWKTHRAAKKWLKEKV